MGPQVQSDAQAASSVMQPVVTHALHAPPTPGGGSTDASQDVGAASMPAGASVLAGASVPLPASELPDASALPAASPAESGPAEPDEELQWAIEASAIGASAADRHENVVMR